MNRMNYYCNNCNKRGHYYNNCKEPIVSYGVICVSSPDNEYLKMNFNKAQINKNIEINLDDVMTKINEMPMDLASL